LEVNATPEVLGIDDPHPRFSWQISTARPHTQQTRFRLLVATKPELLSPGRVDVWDSQIVSTDATAVVYAGPTLKSRTRYYWSIKIWTEAQTSSVWANPTFFETAYLNSNDWRGKWISGPARPSTLSADRGKADEAWSRY